VDEAVVEGAAYEERLREEFEKQHGAAPAWAKKDSAASSGAREALDRSTVALRGLSGALPPEKLSVTRAVDGNQSEPSRAVVQSCEFFPGATPLLMTAGLDRRLRFFEVDGSKNRHVHTAMLSDLPVRKAAVVRGGAEVLAVGRRPFFYVYDVRAARSVKVPRVGARPEKSWESVVVPSASDAPLWAFLGDEGTVSFVSSTSHLLVGSVSIPGSVRAAAFDPSGSAVWASGSDAILRLIDLRMRRIVHSIADEGASPTTALAMAPNGATLAVGSEAGIVNLYSTADLVRTAQDAEGESFFAAAAVPTATPLRAVPNLTTTIHGLRFNHNAEALAFWSHGKKDALRVLHTASRTVFQDWPTERTPLKHVQAVDFSPNGAFLAIGNDRGRALLYRLNHYAEY
jgi:U3 small nucleolar RNA-associated protein 18